MIVTGLLYLQAAVEGALDGHQAAGQLLLLVPPAEARQRGHLRALLAPGKLLLAVTHLGRDGGPEGGRERAGNTGALSPAGDSRSAVPE